jgi:hypothetical protein
MSMSVPFGTFKQLQCIAAILFLLWKQSVRGNGASSASSNESADGLIIATNSGRIRGVRFLVPYLPRPVDAYLGIPYAQPPVGSLRFRHPQPVESWTGIYNATRLPNACHQLPDYVFGTVFQVRNDEELLHSTQRVFGLSLVISEVPSDTSVSRANQVATG